MPSGWAVLCDNQCFSGYSLLLPDPVVVDLAALDKEQRMQFLYDMSLLGEAIQEVTGAYRINYAILGNTVPALHAHVIPRYKSEPDNLRCRPIWEYSEEIRKSVPFSLEEHKGLIEQVAEALHNGTPQQTT